MNEKYNQQKSIVRQILKDHGPLLGSELSHFLINMSKVSSTYARQIIYRLKNSQDILSTDPVKFQKNQVLYFLPRQAIKTRLREILPDQAKTLYRIFQALVELDGFLFWSEFVKISGGVVNPNKSDKKLASIIFNEMKNLGIVEDLYDFQGDSVVIANKDWVPNTNANSSAMLKREQDLSFTQTFTDDLLKWLERMNFVGWNSTKLFSEEDLTIGYNGFYWDAIGYSYLWGLYRTNQRDDLYSPAEQKAGSLVVIESIIHRKVMRHDINGFISRVGNIFARVKQDKFYKIIPVCFAESIEDSALQLARRRGIMVIRLIEVFGSKIANSLKSIRSIDPRKVDAEMLAKILKEADESGQDGKFGTLKGFVFNFLVAYIFCQYQLIPKVGVKYQDPDNKERTCECDIIAPFGNDYLIVCETKGYNTNNLVQLGDTSEDPDSVRKFFEKTCDIVAKRTGKDIIPIFITSSTFNDDAKEYLEKKNKSRKIKRKLERLNFPRKIYYDRKDILDLFGNDSQYTSLKQILREFFTKQ